MATPPYSDLPSPPTVVADYNRPYDCVNTSGPHLLMVEQPQSKFRFRYKSEMVGTHGQLKAERADRNKAIFPTVKLVNWAEGSVVIRLALFTGEENTNLRRRHVHELGGKNCDKVTGICEMVVDHTTDYTASFQSLGIIHIAKREVKEIIKQRKKSALIDHAKLRRPECSHEDIRQSITPTDMKKIDEEAEDVARNMDLNKVVLRFQAFQYDETKRCYRAVSRFVDSELVVNLKNASTGELKIVRMSECSAPCTGGTEVWMLVEKVKKSNIKIKFFELDSDGVESWSAYGEFSEGDVHHQYAIIFRTPPYRSTNLRSSVRVKVQLERINDKDISEPRDFTYYPESRKRQSPYIESTRVEEDEEYPQGGGGRTKRLCPGPTEHAVDLSFNIGNGRGHLDEETMEALRNYCSRGLAEEVFNLDYQAASPLSTQPSPACTVPSPNHPGASPNSNSNQSFYVRVPDAMEQSQFLPVSSESGGQMQTMGNASSPFMMNPPSVGDSLSPQYLPSFSPVYQVPSPQQVSSPQYQAPSPQQGVVYQQGNSPAYQQTPSPAYQQTPSPVYQQSTSPAYQQTMASPMYQQFSPSDHMVPHSPNQAVQQPSDTIIPPQMMSNQNLNQMQTQQQQLHVIPQIQLQQDMSQQLQRQQIQSQPRQQMQLQQNTTASLNTPPISASTGSNLTASANEFDFNNLVNGAGVIGLPELDIIESLGLDTINPDLFTGSDLQTDCMRHKGTSKKNTKKITVSDIDDLAQSIAGVSITKTKPAPAQPLKTNGNKHAGSMKSVDVAFRVAVSAAESLQAYAATGNPDRLLATHRYLLAVQNYQGDNALHTAVSNKNFDAFHKIMKAASNLRPSELINMQNYSGETPLHLAVRGSDLPMSSRLISTPGSDVSLGDRDGNTPLHLAATLPVSAATSAEIMAALLSRPKNGARSALETALQAYNYHGETAIHMAVCHGNLEAVRQLVGSGTGVHMCERRRGANCLHLAAQHDRSAIADFLIKHTDIAVNSRMFDGNTALHVAVQENNTAICKMLMEAGADAAARNALKIRNAKPSSESSSTDEAKGDEENQDDEEKEEDDDDEDEEDNDDEPNCYTPLDYAMDNTKLLEILKADYSGKAAKNDTTANSCSALDSGIDISASDLTFTN